MKQTFRILFVLVAVMAAVPQTFAGEKKERRMSREQLAQTQARHIAKELAFDSETADKFVTAYGRCQQGVWNLGPRQNGRKEKKDEAMTEAEIKKEIEGRFDHSQKLLDIRRKYYNEYSSFLSQAQIKRVYELESKMMKRISGNKHKASGKERRKK